MSAVDDWRVWQTAQGLSPRTIQARCERVAELARFLGSDPSSATSDDVARFMAMLAGRSFRGRPMSRSSMATYYAHLKAFFAWQVTTERRPDNPCSRVPAPRRPKRYPRPVTDREIEAILSAPMHRRTRMMVLLAVYQGLRVHEIAKVRGEDVNLLDCLLTVAGKGDTVATLPLHPAVAEFAVTFPCKGYWFPTNAGGNRLSGHGGPVLARSVSSIVGEVLDRAGVDGGAHRLRHWYGTRLLKDGANIRVVQQLLRRASLQTTEVYTAVDFDQQREAILSLAPGYAT